MWFGNNKAERDELKKIKAEHFQEISKLLDINHIQGEKLKDIDAEHARALKAQEVEYEQKILSLKHQLALEKEKFEVVKEKQVLEMDREFVVRERLLSEKQYADLKSLSDRERECMMGIVSRAVEAMPHGQQTVKLLTESKVDVTKTRKRR